MGDCQAEDLPPRGHRRRRGGRLAAKHYQEVNEHQSDHDRLNEEHHVDSSLQGISFAVSIVFEGADVRAETHLKGEAGKQANWI